ncbi:uncharacterized protein EDB91DRAFT_1267299 [Suillus paluster]|uniref:uncharacterized protein n=1 Tax=Suillus paluster TaxID=48578 RepID=UPI001B8792E0|nr:uncharacterized protein EDB91DRAFT_1267299 [Suillus paluster]KAG1746698.1 hypothetical protein EDB91DRAFT_1267299 [Suillus paluster]
MGQSKPTDINALVNYAQSSPQADPGIAALASYQLRSQRLLNSSTMMWGASMDDPTARALPDNSSYSAGFLELSLGPPSEPPLAWDISSTFISTIDNQITLAMWDVEEQRMDSFTNSNTGMRLIEMPFQAEQTPPPSGSPDSACADSGNYLGEMGQSLPLEGRDTGASSDLNLEKPDDAWKRVLQLAIVAAGTATFVPQALYQPRGETDREKYVYTANLSPPILFYADKPFELGIALKEILTTSSRRLIDKDDLVLEGGGRSISVRIEWPGYPSWSCQLATRDYRKTPGPITKARLAKNLATCIRRFVKKMATRRMESDSDPVWMVGPRHINVEDLILVSLHHVSQGSWQPQLRLQIRGASSSRA